MIVALRRAERGVRAAAVPALPRPPAARQHARSVRPTSAAGRRSWRQDDTRLHVDAVSVEPDARHAAAARVLQRQPERPAAPVARRRAVRGRMRGATCRRSRRPLPGSAWLLARLRHHQAAPHRVRPPDAAAARPREGRPRVTSAAARRQRVDFAPGTTWVGLQRPGAARGDGRPAHDGADLLPRASSACSAPERRRCERSSGCCSDRCSMTDEGRRECRPDDCSCLRRPTSASVSDRACSTRLRGYDRGRFVADVGAGVTVGIVALPLAMAFAIASGVKPEQGIFTAIIAGFLISALGGSQRADRRAGRRLHRHRLRHRRALRRGQPADRDRARRRAAVRARAGCGSARWCATCRCRSSSASPTASRC